MYINIDLSLSIHLLPLPVPYSINTCMYGYTGWMYAFMHCMHFCVPSRVVGYHRLDRGDVQAFGKSARMQIMLYVVAWYHTRWYPC